MPAKIVEPSSLKIKIVFNLMATKIPGQATSMIQLTETKKYHLTMGPAHLTH